MMNRVKIACAVLLIFVGSVWILWDDSLERRAEKGDLAAMNRLATMYYMHTDTIIRNAESIYWMRKAAQGGDYRSKKAYLHFLIQIRCEDSQQIVEASHAILNDRRVNLEDSLWVDRLVRTKCNR